MWTWNSDPFGTDAANANPTGAGAFAYNLRLPGQLFDGQAGLHQNYFRDYDPATGRFAESDPIGLDGGINPYSYGEDSPVLLTDPTGEDAIALPLPAASTWVGPAAAVVGAGYAGWQIGSAIYPHIAVPLGDAIESVCRATSKARECEREWEDAYRQCQKMLSGRNPPQGVTGGYTSLYDCARGQVSERCGGNPIGPGGTSDWKFKPPGSTRKGRKK
jgi:RHS repeat-associated protein